MGIAAGVRATRLSLHLFGFRSTIRFLGRIPLRRSSRSTPADVARWADAIRRVGRRPYGATCLDRSVFLWFLMRMNHLDGQLRIGVAFDTGSLDGHAWIELDGEVVNDEPDVADRFAVFDGDPVGLAFS